jgi:hypothetical protein
VSFLKLSSSGGETSLFLLQEEIFPSASEVMEEVAQLKHKCTKGPQCDHQIRNNGDPSSNMPDGGICGFWTADLDLRHAHGDSRKNMLS